MIIIFTYNIYYLFCCIFCNIFSLIILILIFSFKLLKVYFISDYCILEKINVNFNFFQNTKNIYLSFLKQLILKQAFMKSFLIFYNQIEFFKNLLSKKNMK